MTEPGDRTIETLTKQARHNYYALWEDGTPYACLVCHDTRWLIGETGATIPCNACPTYETNIEHHRTSGLAAAGFTDSREPKRLKDFKPSIQRRGNSRKEAEWAYHSVTSLLEKQLPHLVVLTGPTGTGKSHLAEGLLDELIRLQQDVIWSTGSIFTHLLRPRGGNDQGPSQFDYRDKLMQCGWLVFDEVALTYDPSRYFSSLYQEIILYRHDANKPTLVTGNLGPTDTMTSDEHIASILGDRVVSRLSDPGVGALCSLWQCDDLRKNRGN